MENRKEKQRAENLYARNVQCLINDYEMKNNSPHKQSQGASGKAPGRKVSHCLLQILKQITQLLRNKRNRYEVPSRPVILSDRKSTRLNSSHANISYAVFCLKKIFF